MVLCLAHSGAFGMLVFFGFNALLLLSLSWKVEHSCEQMCPVSWGWGGALPFTGSPRRDLEQFLFLAKRSPTYPSNQSSPLSIRTSLLPPGPREGMLGTLALPIPCALNSPAGVLHQQAPPLETSEGAGRLEVDWRGCCCPEHVRWL